MLFRYWIQIHGIKDFYEYLTFNVTQLCKKTKNKDNQSIKQEQRVFR